MTDLCDELEQTIESLEREIHKLKRIRREFGRDDFMIKADELWNQSQRDGWTFHKYEVEYWSLWKKWTCETTSISNLIRMSEEAVP